MAKWSKSEVENVVDYRRLVRKMGDVDLQQLIDTTKTLLQELIDNPKVNVQNAEGELQHLESIRTAPVENLSKYDYHLVVLAFRKLAKIIIIQHFAELTHFKNGKGKFPVENLIVSPRLGKLLLNVRSSGVHEMSLFLDAEDGLRDVIYKTLTPESTGAGWRHLLPVTKIMLDLFSMEDYGLDSIRAYSKSQHDWALACTSRMLIGRKGWYAYGVSRKYDQFFVSAVTTSLMYGCGAADTEAGIKMIGPLGPSYARGEESWTDNLNLIQSVSSVSGVVIDDSDLYDKGFVEFVLSYESRSSVCRYYPFHTIKKYHHYVDRRSPLICTIDDAKANYHREFTPMKATGHVMVDSIIFPYRHMSKGECRAGGFPDDLKSKITRDYLRELESRTKFIHNFLASNCFATGIMKTGVEDGKPVTVEDVHEMVKHYDLESRQYVLPFMICPPNNGKALLDHGYPMRYVPADAEGGYDEVDRFRAFVKTYILHQMVRTPEIMTDHDVTVSPLDVLVITDVVEAINRVNDRLLMDSGSDWFRRLTDRCLEVLRESTGERSTSFEEFAVLADDTSHIYAEMLDGNARDLEETLQRIDDVLVDSLIDYYVGCELGESTLPADFFMENLQMETLDGYESAVQDCLDLEPARELEDVLAEGGVRFL